MPDILSLANLPVATLEFPANRDTILTSKGGIIFHLPANAFLDADNKPYKGEVKIELIEAFELENMVLGGLTTHSEDGRFLESSGMFRLEIKGNGKQLKIDPKKKIMLMLPVTNSKEKAQFFYASQEDYPALKWISSEQLNLKSNNDRLLLGHTLLFMNCASCHNMDLVSDMTGPALVWVTKRWNTMEELFAFTRNSEATALGKSLRARAMVDWDASAMVPFEDLTDEELSAIYYYIDETARTRGIDSSEHRAWSDEEYKEMFAKQNALREKYWLDSIRQKSTVLYRIPALLDTRFRWGNINQYMRTGAPVQKKLEVEVLDDFDYSFIKVRIIFPDRNAIFSAYPSKQDKKGYYSFTEGYNLARTPFPIGEKAYLMATAFKENELYFQLKEIKIGDQEREQLNLELSSKEAIIETIKTTF
ncbi:c-type cytochrome [Aureispira anguillae]|nr:cytochrome c [Aureispira anguillae]